MSLLRALWYPKCLPIGNGAKVLICDFFDRECIHLKGLDTPKKYPQGEVHQAPNHIPQGELRQDVSLSHRKEQQ